MPTYEQMIQEFATELRNQDAGVTPIQPLEQAPGGRQPQQVEPQQELSYEQMIRSSVNQDAKEQSLQRPEVTEEGYSPAKDKIGFWENIERGGWGGFFDKASFGVRPLVEAAELFGATKRFQENLYGDSPIGQYYKDKDEEKIFTYLEEQAEIAERGKTIGAKVGDLLGNMLPFMAEFIATGGAASIGKAAASKAVRRLLIRLGGKAAARSLAGKSTASLAGWVSSFSIRTALTPHRSLQNFIDERMPNIQVSPEGQLIFKESEDSPFRSAYKAIGNQLIEMASEESGAFLGVLGGKVVSKLLPKGAIEALNKLKNAWMGAVGGRTAQEFAEKMATKVGFNGILEEYSEERLGALMRVAAGIDDGEGTTFEKIGRALYPGNEQAFVELIAFSVPGVVRAGAAQAFSRKEAKEELGIDRPTSAEERQVLADKVETTRAEAEIGEADAERVARQAEQAGEEVGIEGEAEEGVRVRDVAEGEERPEAPVKPKGRKFAEADVQADIEALTKPVAKKPKGRKKKAVEEKVEQEFVEFEDVSSEVALMKTTEVMKELGEKFTPQQVEAGLQEWIKTPEGSAIASLGKEGIPQDATRAETFSRLLLSETPKAVAAMERALAQQVQKPKKGRKKAIAEPTTAKGHAQFIELLKSEKQRLEAEKIEFKGDRVGGKLTLDTKKINQQIADIDKDIAFREGELKTEKAFGAKNTAFKKEQFEKDKAAEAEAEPLRGKPKKGQRKGAARVFTAEDLKRAGRIAGFYFEGGLREFKAWSAKLIEVLGSPIKPHLEKLWAQAKKDVEAFEAEAAPVEKPKGRKEPVKKEVTDLPTANVSSEVDESLGKVLSVKNLAMGEVRDDLGLGAVPSAQRKAQQTSVDNAIAKNIPADALRIATDVQENPRLMTDEEEAGLLVRSVQLRDQYEGARKEIMAAPNEAEKTLLNAEMDRIEAEFDIISLSLKTSGTEIARALAFRRNFIDEHYDILSIKTRAKAAKGKDLTEAQTAKFEELVAKLDEANRKLDEAVKRLDELTAEGFVGEAKKKRKKGKAPIANIGRLSARINELLEQGCI